MIRRISLKTRTLLALAAIGLGLGVAAPYLFPKYMVGLVSLALIGGLFAQSVDLLAGYVGLVTLGQAGISGAAAYGVGYMASKVGAGFPAQIAVGLLAGMLASLLFGLMAMRSNDVYFIMITLAQGMIVWGLSIRLYKVTGAENGLTGIPRPELVNPYWKYYYLVLIVVVVCWMLLGVIVKSPFGTSLKGLRESETRMRMLGYNTTAQKLYVFMLAGFFATIAGILLVYLNGFISPSSVVLSASAIGVLEAILGGVGTLIGPMIGAFIIVAVQNIVSIYVNRWPTLMGLIFVVVVLFARRGLVGAISDVWNRRQREVSLEPQSTQ
ncbi:MAG: branched-chain amino acid ABC transporter permease [Acidimicrobiia bacterium]|nr:branched-chain amino acid ABC transporter permease [Acidimicrobiia bacterium]